MLVSQFTVFIVCERRCEVNLLSLGDTCKFRVCPCKLTLFLFTLVVCAWNASPRHPLVTILLFFFVRAISVQLLDGLSLPGWFLSFSCSSLLFFSFRIRSLHSPWKIWLLCWQTMASISESLPTSLELVSHWRVVSAITVLILTSTTFASSACYILSILTLIPLYAFPFDQISLLSVTFSHCHLALFCFSCFVFNQGERDGTERLD